MSKKGKFNFKLLLKVFIYIGGLLVAIYLVVLASGYKYDSRVKRFVSTGNIYISSIPRDVKIYVDDKLKAERTPYKLGYLLPGSYKVRIEKEGFKNWEKTLVVKAGLVSNEPDVVLFYKEPKEETFNNIDNVVGITANQAKDNILFWSDSTLYQQATNAKEPAQLLRFSDFVILNVISNHGLNKILVQVKEPSGFQDFQYCPDKECKNLYDLSRGLGLNFDSGKTTNDDTYPLLMSTQKNLYSVRSDYAKYYIDSNVLDYIFFKGRVYYFHLKQDEVEIIDSNPEGQDKKTIATQKLGGCLQGCFSLWVDDKNDRLYLTGEARKLYLYEERGQRLNDLMTKATNLNFDNPNLMLIQNSSELKLIGKIELTDKDEDLHQVARFSADIFSPGWLVRRNHILYIKGDKLESVETRGSNQTELYKYFSDSTKNYIAISQNEVIVLDDYKLKKVTLCEKGGLLNFR